MNFYELEYIKQNVIEYIINEKDIMIYKGLGSVYISIDPYDDTISIIYINKCIHDHDYWRHTREETRMSGATFVSNYLINKCRDIKEFKKLDLEINNCNY